LARADFTDPTFAVAVPDDEDFVRNEKSTPPELEDEPNSKLIEDSGNTMRATLRRRV
jgi:hypothetical protein